MKLVLPALIGLVLALPLLSLQGSGDIPIAPVGEHQHSPSCEPCPVTVEAWTSSSGAIPGGCLFSIDYDSSNDKSGKKRRPSPCNANNTCESCSATFTVSWTSDGGHDLKWRRDANGTPPPDWKPIGSGTVLDVTPSVPCGNVQPTEFSIEDGGGVITFTVTFETECCYCS